MAKATPSSKLKSSKPTTSAQDATAETAEQPSSAPESAEPGPAPADVSGTEPDAATEAAVPTSEQGEGAPTSPDAAGIQADDAPAPPASEGNVPPALPSTEPAPPDDAPPAADAEALAVVDAAATGDLDLDKAIAELERDGLIEKVDGFTLTEAQEERLRAVSEAMGEEAFRALLEEGEAWSREAERVDETAFPETILSLALRGVDFLKKLTGGEADLLEAFVSRFRDRYPETPVGREMMRMLGIASPVAQADALEETGFWRVLKDRQWWHQGASAQCRKGDVVCRMTHNVDAMLQQKVPMEICSPPGPLSYEARGLMPPPAPVAARPQLPTEPQRDGNSAALRKGTTGSDLG